MAHLSILKIGYSSGNHHGVRVPPGRVDVVFRALQNVSPSQLADRALFDFAGL